jgi:hypothetical protein
MSYKQCATKLRPMDLLLMPIYIYTHRNVSISNLSGFVCVHGALGSFLPLRTRLKLSKIPEQKSEGEKSDVHRWAQKITKF